MSRWPYRFLVSLTFATAIAACGGDKDDNKDTNDSPEAVRAALTATNLSSGGFPWSSLQPGALKRWQLPIPVKLNSEPRAIAAADEIERRLGMTIFDRTSISSTPDNLIARGIIVSVGTSYIPPGSTNPCQGSGGVAGAPNSGSYPSPFLTGAEISARLYVNLDNSGCSADYEVTVHEFGHALGMGSHYDGFGNGGAISSLFWRVLHTMYANPIGSSASTVVVP